MKLFLSWTVVSLLYLYFASRPCKCFLYLLSLGSLSLSALNFKKVLLRFSAWGIRFETCLQVIATPASFTKKYVALPGDTSPPYVLEIVCRGLVNFKAFSIADSNMSCRLKFINYLIKVK